MSYMSYMTYASYSSYSGNQRGGRHQRPGNCDNLRSGLDPEDGNQKAEGNNSAFQTPNSELDIARNLKSTKDQIQKTKHALM